MAWWSRYPTKSVFQLSGNISRFPDLSGSNGRGWKGDVNESDAGTRLFRSPCHFRPETWALALTTNVLFFPWKSRLKGTLPSARVCAPKLNSSSKNSLSHAHLNRAKCGDVLLSPPPLNGLGFLESDSLAQLRASKRQIARFVPPRSLGRTASGETEGWVMAEWSDNSKTQGETRVSVRTTKRCSLLYCGQTSYAVIAKNGNSIISDEMKQHVYFSSPMKTPHLSLHTRYRQTVESCFAGWMREKIL